GGLGGGLGGASGAVELPRTLSLKDVLERVSHANREKGVDLYWRYFVLQSRRSILERHLNVAGKVAHRIFNDSASPEAGRVGLVAEGHSLLLRAELLELEIESWKRFKELNALCPQPFLSRGSNPTLPLATTSPKTENFEVRLDIAAASDRHSILRPKARHLEFCISKLPTAHAALEQTLSLLLPEESESDKLVRETSYAEIGTLFQTLRSARDVSRGYLRLLYNINVLQSSCILHTSNASDSALSLSKKMSSSDALDPGA
ncbi:MAG: hypothetical protein Q4D38_13840, partial [Planctomycetia bacterium]|nr:hypothetical protein [Planctomycetia bacterium]